MCADVIYPKVAVLCLNSSGEPEFYSCTPAVTHDQMISGDHYNLAKESAADHGYEEPMIAFDATDTACKQLIETANWFK